ncbi:MAG TPA: hypothetical protein GXX75_05350 [Clostridiales bacterium]|nr:hypothetical protein [Clostridiales bacterium]
MKIRYDVVHAVVLLLVLMIAFFVGNTVIKGVLLLLFAAVLLLNTVYKLREKKEAQLRSKLLVWILLILDIILAVCAIDVIINGIVSI